ncbi:tetratricopeptide repeat protein 36 [Neocloeon triangulifer]|uniref:tetratricopeptide repeat protein 36 n=1 Tax=Neocloeon triangulifer TaxID=2078957 RepID=UPI00286EFB05|nr:tetratricopeptide repeat protein 36 [Neocloeon triangulifer]
MSNEHDQAVLNSIFNPLLPVGEAAFEFNLPVDDDEEISAEIEEAKRLELQGVQAAEAGKIDEAIAIFTHAIAVAPGHASGYNNRAQALRLKGNMPGALVDLNKALSLTGGKGKSACQAFCQRAQIFMKEGHQDMAKKDLEAAAAQGNAFAKTQLAQMNPYAALCNKMLQEAFLKLQRGEPDCQTKS